VLLTPDDGLNVGIGLDGSLSVSAFKDYNSWSIGFYPALGSTLTPGTYDDIAPYQDPSGKAALEISPGCSNPVGRFVVHELSTQFLEGDRGQAAAVAIDFEQRCPDDGSTFSGALRIRAGDPDCVGAPDGTPCDDRDACTRSSTCQGGFCRGS